MIITSFSNQQVKQIRKLDQKKYRQETGQFFIEGLRTVGEAVQTGASIETLVIAPELLVSEFGQSLLRDPAIKNVNRIEVSAEIYQKLAHKQGPQGIGAVLRKNWHTLNEVQATQDDLWVTLDAIADPGNLGTIMRTAEAVGTRGLILLGNATDPYDPTAVKASMGAIFSLQLIHTDWDHFRAWQSSQHVNLVGTSDRGESDYQAVTYKRPLCLLMGCERHGLTSEMLHACDQMVSIPMVGRADSLNLAVATGIVLYEIFNQSRKLDTIEP